MTIHTIEPTLNDAEAAQQIKARLTPALEAVTKIMNEAKTQGYAANFQIGLDGFGRHTIQTISIVKPLI